MIQHAVVNRKFTGSIPDDVIKCFNLPNHSSRTMGLNLSQPLTDMSTRNIPWGKARPARKSDSFTAACEPIV
jgi:hypothetical protein